MPPPPAAAAPHQRLLLLHLLLLLLLPLLPHAARVPRAARARRRRRLPPIIPFSPLCLFDPTLPQCRGFSTHGVEFALGSANSARHCVVLDRSYVPAVRSRGGEGGVE